MSQGLCISCGYVGRMETITKVSTDTETILWFCFLIPGLIYSIWRFHSRHEECPICDQATIIPADSSEAQKIIRKNRAKQVAAAIPEFRPPSKPAIGVGRVVGRFVGRLLNADLHPSNAPAQQT
ncbi:MAG: hypothetical protein IPN81_00440 [Nitrosomonadales bacterium]|jgi:hypothetical protein|nr:hypothetical protein [Nitrosomonadales bacterium]MBL0038024.1 hypothetical protein [Nitrosomonadales bacterium]